MQSFDDLVYKLTSINFVYWEVPNQYFLQSINQKISADILRSQKISDQILMRYHNHIKKLEKKFYNDVRQEVYGISQEKERWLLLNGYIEEIHQSGLTSEVIDATTFLVNNEEWLINDFTEDIQPFFKKLKKIHKEIIAHIIKELKAYKLNLTRVIHSDDIEAAEKITTTTETQNKAVKSFHWNPDRQDALRALYEHGNGILFDTDLNTLHRAFNGKKLKLPGLNIKWILKQKRNKANINKRAIFSFIQQLHVKGFIKEAINLTSERGSSANAEIYDKVCLIFCDDEGKSFNRLNIRQNFSNYGGKNDIKEINKVVAKLPR